MLLFTAVYVPVFTAVLSISPLLYPDRGNTLASRLLLTAKIDTNKLRTGRVHP